MWQPFYIWAKPCFIYITKGGSPEVESVAYRVLALTFAAGLSLSFAALAKEHCPVGQVYFRSKHVCISKGTPVALKIYHYRPQAAKAHEAAIHGARPSRKAATTRPQTPPREAASPAKLPLPPPRVAALQAKVPLPPPRPMRNIAASPPARNGPGAQSAATVAPAPEMVHRSASPYGELVPVTPAK